ncbi:hypothetical protein [Sphingomonas sp. VNH70]|uniref:hypothetical protein n=1 Tax=Sphingomonas silueang TaxID=3156617 RepID=UPI0032B507D3
MITLPTISPSFTNRKLPAALIAVEPPLVILPPISFNNSMLDPSIAAPLPLLAMTPELPICR